MKEVSKFASNNPGTVIGLGVGMAALMAYGIYNAFSSKNLLRLKKVIPLSKPRIHLNYKT